MNTTNDQGLDVSPPPPLSASLVPAAGGPVAPAGAARAAAAPAFLRAPGETPRAFGAFKVFFELGHARSLPAVADQLAEPLSTVKKWSGRHQWFKRIADFDAGLLQQQAEARLVDSREHAADWTRRAREWRDQEWESAQQLRAAARCFLDSFGDEQIEKMTLTQASQVFQIAARLARQALADAPLPETTVHAPIQLEIETALKKAFGPGPGAAAGSESPASNPATFN